MKNTSEPSFVPRYRVLRTMTGTKTHIDMSEDNTNTPEHVRTYEWLSEAYQAPACLTSVKYRMPTLADECSLDEAAEAVTCERCSEIVRIAIERAS